LGAAVGVDGAEVDGQIHHARDQGHLAVNGVLQFWRSLKIKQENGFHVVLTIGSLVIKKILNIISGIRPV